MDLPNFGKTITEFWGQTPNFEERNSVSVPKIPEAMTREAHPNEAAERR